MPTQVEFCWRNVEKRLIVGTQWTDRWVHVVVRRVHVGVLGRYIFRRTPSTSDADTRPRPAPCVSRLWKHAKICRDAAAVAGERVLRDNRTIKGWSRL